MWKWGQLATGYWSMASLFNFLVSPSVYLYVCLAFTVWTWHCCKTFFSSCICLLRRSCCFFLAEYHHREKRQAHDHKKNTCPLLLVADYRFFEHMGRGQESVTLNYLVCPYDAICKTPTKQCRKNKQCKGLRCLERWKGLQKDDLLYWCFWLLLGLISSKWQICEKKQTWKSKLNFSTVVLSTYLLIKSSRNLLIFFFFSHSRLS